MHMPDVGRALAGLGRDHDHVASGLLLLAVVSAGNPTTSPT